MTQSVLLVDDNLLQLKLNRARLAGAGFEVATASCASEALESVRRSPPDAILCDVVMAGVDGFTLCQQLRREPGLGRVPVVLVSAQFHDEGDRELAVRVGASALVERSPGFERELAALASALTGGQPVAAARSPAPTQELYVDRVSRELVRLAGASTSAELRYRALFEQASDPISVLTVDGVILEANRRVLDILQYSSEEMVGHHIREFAAPGHEQANVERYRDALEDSAGHAQAFAIRRKDGEIVYLSFSAAPVEIDGETIVFSTGRDVTKAIEDARRLEASEERYRTLVESIPDIVWSMRPDGQISFISPNVTTILGFTQQEFIDGVDGVRFARIHPEDAARVKQAFAEFTAGGRVFDVEYRWHHKDGRWVWVHNRALSISHQDGVESVHGVMSDVTERRRLEEQMRQSQKMEAVGQLTGGVAHDFNNILAAILSYSQFLIQSFDEQDPRREDAEEIKGAAERAATLTRQLMAFSRRQVLDPKPFDLDRTLGGIEKMLRRVIGADVELSVIPCPDLGTVCADVGQIEQVVMNLVVNARDAMPHGGKLILETSNVELDGIPHVMLAVSDTGCGMDAATLARIFEPFFTTKEKDRGTGLGLSTSYGIIKQSGGHIHACSEVERGTVFKIYLPRIGDAPAARRDEPVAAAPGGSETILLVEDDTRVRAALIRVLDRLGYQVLPAGDGEGALELLREHGDPIDLILSDVILPGESGPDVVRRIQAGSPGTPVIFMSGYTDHVALSEGLLDSGAAFLQKPFAPDALAHKIRDVLDAQVIGAPTRTVSDIPLTS